MLPVGAQLAEAQDVAGVGFLVAVRVVTLSILHVAVLDADRLTAVQVGGQVAACVLSPLNLVVALVEALVAAAKEAVRAVALAEIVAGVLMMRQADPHLWIYLFWVTWI